MFPFPYPGIRTGALAVILGAGLASTRPVENLVTRADSGKGAPDSNFERADGALPTLKGVRLSPVVEGTPRDETPPCSVVVAYPDADRQVTLTEIVADRDCPSALNTKVGLTFEIDNPKGRRNLWWRRAESSFDVLYPSTGSLPATGKNRVSLSNLVLDQTVTIEVLEGDQRLLSFTLKHF